MGAPLFSAQNRCVHKKFTKKFVYEVLGLDSVSERFSI